MEGHDVEICTTIAPNGARVLVPSGGSVNPGCCNSCGLSGHDWGCEGSERLHRFIVANVGFRPVAAENEVVIDFAEARWGLALGVDE